MRKRFERDHAIMIEIAHVLQEVQNEGHCVVGYSADGDWDATDVAHYVEPILIGLKCGYSLEKYGRDSEATAVIRTYY